jgi:hypothetical protein
VRLKAAREKGLIPARKRAKIGLAIFLTSAADQSNVNQLDRENAEELDGLTRVLKPAQERVLAEIGARPDEKFTRADYEILAHVSRSQAAYDLAELVKLGIVERLGSGRATCYRVAQTGAGRRRKWTPERIRNELESLCAELGWWPRASEFKDAGRGDLYLAASRYGGIEYWAEELGYSEREALEPSESKPFAGTRERHLRPALAGAGLATLGALAALGLLLIGGDRPAPENTAATALVRESHDATGRPVVDGGSPPKRHEVALRLAAAGGTSWLAVRRDSADGRLLWEGILERGKSLRFQGRLWLRLGAPSNLVAYLNGDRAGLPGRTSTARVTDKGIRVIEVAQPVVLAAAEEQAPEPVSQTASSGSTSQASPESTSQASSGSTSQASSSPSGGGGPSPDPAPSRGSNPSPDPPPGD